MTVDVEIDGVEYRTGPLDAKTQFHVARRLAPLIAKVAAMPPEATAPMNGAINGNGEAQPDNIQGFANLALTLADALSSLSDDDCDFVINRCMSVVSRKQNDRYVPAWNRQADRPQFSDMSMAAMLQLTVAVIQDNLGSFIPARLQTGQPNVPASPPHVN